MDISIRDWMIIIGVLLVVAVLLDGYRRMRKNPKKVRVALIDVPAGGDGEAELHLRGELPAGGARVIGRSGEAESADSEGEEPPLAEPAAELSQMSALELGENLDLLEQFAAASEGTTPAASEDAPIVEATTQPTEARTHPDVEPEVLILHVIARDEDGFAGNDILQVLLALELRFGEMDFFHRHEQAAGRGKIEFSVANMLQPGVFDIDAMAGFTTSGLIFFLSLPGPKDMMAAFDLMAETAQSVADNLAGDLLDDTRSAITRQTLEHMRQRIRDLERRMLTQAPRQG
jgi:cell division protein ZipA